MVDVGARELGCDVPDGTPEDRINKVLLLKEETLVVGAFASVVEGKDAGMFSTDQVCSPVLPADRIIRMGRVEWWFRPSTLNAALVNFRFVRKSILFCNPGKEAGELGVGRRVLAVLKELESCRSVFCARSHVELFAAFHKA